MGNCDDPVCADTGGFSREAGGREASDAAKKWEIIQLKVTIAIGFFNNSNSFL